MSECHTAFLFQNEITVRTNRFFVNKLVRLLALFSRIMPPNFSSLLTPEENMHLAMDITEDS